MTDIKKKVFKKKAAPEAVVEQETPEVANTSGEATPVAAEAPAKKKAKAPAGPKVDSQRDKIKQLLGTAGTNGLTAAQIGEKLGVITADMEASVKSVALRKLRTSIRGAVGGASQQRDGKAAIYVLPQ